ncbi:MAG: hypothetical protein GX589_11200 [Deltaproteobacteria bacterium]|nr:hypothetical protein [Deltaproteobacteria bacterium]
MKPSGKQSLGAFVRADNNSHGGALLLFMLAVPVMIMLFGLAVQLGAYGVGLEQSRHTAKMILLGASEAYFQHNCSGDGTLSENCHQAKLQAAITMANQLAVKSKGQSLYPISAGSFGSSPKVAQRLFVPGRYAAMAPPDGLSDPCNGEYPCFHSRETGELANAFKLVGSVVDNPFLARFEKFLGMKNFFKTMRFDVTAAAVPMRMCAVIDLSGSIAADTHPEEYDTVPPHANIAPLFAYNSDQNGVVTTQDKGADQVKSAANLPERRGNNVDGHYKDDYSLVKAVDLMQIDNYEEAAWHRAPDADLGSFVTASEATAGERYYLLDLYRSGSYKGAEPWKSIMDGVRGVAEAFRDRSVAGDRICLVFFDKFVRWPYTVRLTGDFNYVINLLQTEVPTAAPKCPPKTTLGGEECTVLNDPPPWVKLGLFPQPSAHTDVYAGLGQALFEFSQDNLGVPSTDFVTLFSDGLATCYMKKDVASKKCRSRNHEYYRNAMRAIRDELIFSPAQGVGYFKGNIALHMFMAGDDVAPHTLLLKKDGKCLTDEEARKEVDHNGMPAPIDFVLGQGLNVYDETVSPQAQSAFETPPFYQANADWYSLVRMTGGRWAPIRTPANCTPMQPTCTENAERLLQDPECRSSEKQVRGYLEQVLRDSSGFTIVYDQAS